MSSPLSNIYRLYWQTMVSKGRFKDFFLPGNIIVYDHPTERHKYGVSGPKTQRLQSTDFPGCQLVPSRQTLDPESSCTHTAQLELIWSLQVECLDWAILADIVWELVRQSSNHWLIASSRDHPLSLEHPRMLRSVELTNTSPSLGSLESSVETWGQLHTIDLKLTIPNSFLTPHPSGD